MKIKRENYITIQGWMSSELGLKGNELIVYAIIYGFSQEEDNEFTGSLEYLTSWTNSTRRGMLNVLKNLLDKKLIIKKEVFKGSIKFCTYKVNESILHTVEKSSTDDGKIFHTVEKSSTDDGKIFYGAVEKISTNNIDNNIVNNNISSLEKIVEEFELENEWYEIISIWFDYKKTKKQTYKSITSEKVFVKHLLNLSNKNVNLAREIIENSIANNYSGIFMPKNIDNKRVKESKTVSKPFDYDAVPWSNY